MNKEVSGKQTSGINIPPWLATTKPLKFNSLRKDISVDVVIVGGGISGLTIAYMLGNEKPRAKARGI